MAEKGTGMTVRPFVYIASPYTAGDPCINTQFQCRVFDQMLTDGVVWPYAPLISHFQHTLYPRPYQDWVDYDLALIDRFDACVRLNATHGGDYHISESNGADEEVRRFKEQGKPVFWTIEDCYEWASELQPPPLPKRTYKRDKILRQIF